MTAPPPVKVAVIGGDKSLNRIEWPDSLQVVTYLSKEGDRLYESICNGGVTKVVCLVRWVGHSMFYKLKNNSKAKVYMWNRGTAELARNIEQLVLSNGLDHNHTTDAPGDDPTAPVAEYVKNQAKWAQWSPQKAPTLIDIESEEMPATTQVESKDEKPMIAEFDGPTSKPMRKPGELRQEVLDTFRLDPTRTWTAREVSEFLGLKDYTTIYHPLQVLFEMGEIEHVSGNMIGSTLPNSKEAGRYRLKMKVPAYSPGRKSVVVPKYAPTPTKQVTRADMPPPVVPAPPPAPAPKTKPAAPPKAATKAAGKMTGKTIDQAGVAFARAKHVVAQLITRKVALKDELAKIDAEIREAEKHVSDAEIELNKLMGL